MTIIVSGTISAGLTASASEILVISSGATISAAVSAGGI